MSLVVAFVAGGIGGALVEALMRKWWVRVIGGAVNEALKNERRRPSLILPIGVHDPRRGTHE